MSLLRSIVLAMAGLASLASCVAAPPKLGIAEDVDRIVSETLAEVGTEAGVAIAVYTPDGRYTGAFGIADAATGEPVTPETAFYIASSTKSFTALTMLLLEERARLSLSTSLADFSPDAAFPDEIGADAISLGDLLTHTSGIQNDAVVYRTAYTGDHSPALLFDLVAFTQVNDNAPPGSFEYTNFGYNLLTLLTDRQFGEPWQDSIQSEVIDILGLTRTSARMSTATEAGWQVARPHLLDADGNLVRSSVPKTDATMHSAGGVVMSAQDALKWLELFVEDGSVGGRQVISPSVIAATRAPLVPVGKDFGPYRRDAYGMGWYVGRYGNDALIHHFGGFPGYRAHVSYMPDRKIGVAVFVNEAVAGSLLTDELANFVYDSLIDGEPVEVDSKALSERYARTNDRIRMNAAARAKRTWRLDSPQASYAGTYRNAALGDVNLREENERLIVTMGVLEAPLEPYDAEEAARVELIPFSGRVIRFKVKDGAIIGFSLNGQYFERV